jgi:hypothetical protein
VPTSTCRTAAGQSAGWLEQRVVAPHSRVLWPQLAILGGLISSELWPHLLILPAGSGMLGWQRWRLVMLSRLKGSRLRR